MIFRCVECDETRDSDWEDGTALGPDGLICTLCVEDAEDLEIDMADMIYAHAQEATL